MKDDLSALKNMIYSGRGIIVGKTPSGNRFIGYSLTGRSPPSQARELVKGEKTKTIRTNVTDEEELKKGSPALLLYPAIVPVKDALIASNGAQTKLIYTILMINKNILSPEYALSEAFKEPFWEYDQKEDRWIDITTYEPDAPNNTPRISACIIGDRAATCIIKHKEDGEKQIIYNAAELESCKGRLITTYQGGNEEPLLSFFGRALDVVINSETAEGIAENIYAAIYGGEKPGDNYRIAAAVILHNTKTGGLETKIINRSERGN